jgi:multiple sugar transport system substrate-binding protein
MLCLIVISLAGCAKAETPTATVEAPVTNTEAPVTKIETAAPTVEAAVTKQAATPEIENTVAPAKTEKIVLRGLYQKQAGVQVEDMDRLTAEYEASHPNIDIQWEYVAYEAIHDKVVTAAMAHTGSYDIVILDGIWPAEFAEAGFILDVTDKITDEMKKGIFPGALEEVMYKDRYWGIPFLNGVEWFYYNDKMLKAAGYTEPPTTWEQVKEMGLAAKQKGVIDYPIIAQFGQSEVMVCDYTIYLYAFGGQFFTKDLKPAFNSPEGVAALQYLIDGVKSGLYNPASLESGSEEIRRIFSQGKAMFMVNWTYAGNLLEDPKESNVIGQTKAALMPGTDKAKSATVNGGEGLSIMADSKHPDEAWDFMSWLIKPDVNITYANRTLPLWSENFVAGGPVEKAQPKIASFASEQLSYMVNRPIVPYYTQASEILQRELQSALLGQKTAEKALADAEQAILKLQAEFK